MHGNDLKFTTTLAHSGYIFFPLVLNFNFWIFQEGKFFNLLHIFFLLYMAHQCIGLLF